MMVATLQLKAPKLIVYFVSFTVVIFTILNKLFYKCLDDILLSKKYFSEKLQNYFATPSSAKVLKISQNSETVFVNFALKLEVFCYVYLRLP